MKTLKAWAQRALGLCLAALLVVPALAAEPLSAGQRREDLDFLYEKVLKGAHPNAFANTPESEFLKVKAEIEGRLETETDTEFLLDLMRLTALVGDSHTSVSVGSLADFRGYPLSLIRRGESWYLSAAAPEDKNLLCREVVQLAGKPVEEVIEAYGALFSSDNPVHLRRSFRQACNVADIYEYLGLVEAGEPLTVTLKGGETLTLEPVGMEERNKLEAVRISDKIKGQPETAARDAYYFARPLTEDAYYIQYNVCREAEDLSMEDFAALVAKDLEAGDYDRVLLDLRNNGGGSDGVIWPLFEVLREAMDGGARLVGLIGENTFSSALINAVEIQEMGGTLAGENAGGSVCHFGAVKTFSLPNSKVRGQVSGKYLDLNTLLDAAAGRGVVALAPDIHVPQELADTLDGKDSLVEWCLTAPEQQLTPANHYDAPLTRGRFIGQLYEAAGSPAVEIGEALPFADSFGIEWYLPAVAWARDQGVAQGGADGRFYAARPITWREAAVFLSRTAKALEIPLPSPAEHRQGPVPAELAQGWEQDTVADIWDAGLLLPSDADFSKGLTRSQGEELAAALAGLLN
ncbi:S-layer homology domain-containing protein [uncultured Oscillibacter sp.]|uniref:S-layer homology domain-containing protein n=1 Tax=uncultured Oscillibacter sp. TaxID=876091 RepID=UPI00260B48EE|nr:S-layer homology domain-containing protein [uncultured Oscillibacter sp.]